MALTAYVDDSVEAKRVLVLAGFISSVERWEAFTKDWENCLINAPWDRSKKTGNRVYKSSEARRRRDSPLVQEYIQHHYEVIKDHARDNQMRAVAVAVRLDDLERFIRKRPALAGTPWANPYSWAIQALIDTLAHLQLGDGHTEPIDWVFDERPEKKQIREYWDVHVAGMPETHRHLMGHEPVFRSDDDFLPIQAADMLAGFTRLMWLEHGTLISTDRFPFPGGSAEDFAIDLLEIPEEEMERMLRVTWEAVNPGRPLP